MNPYAVLGVDPRAPGREIDAAYRRLLRAHHPDLHAAGTPEELAAAEERTRELTVAMEAIRADRSAWRPDGPDPNGDAGREASGRGPAEPFADRDDEELARRVQRLSSYNADPALFDLLVRAQARDPEAAPGEGRGDRGDDRPDPPAQPDERLAALLGLTLAACTVLLLVLVLVELVA